MHLKAETLDDLLQDVFPRLLKTRNRTQSTKGAARELTAALLTIRNPRARFSHTEDRATLFSCLGETLWYLSGSDNLDFIEHYIPSYRTFAGLKPDTKVAPGAYGPRLFGGGQKSQMSVVIGRMKRKKDTRQAIVQIFHASDLLHDEGDVPCTCTLQFLARGNALHLIANMRSNDAYRGLPHDVFAFTLIQELVARCLGVEVGTYSHFVGSLHLYETDELGARRYLNEGWQEKLQMPAMPIGDPWPGLNWLLDQEARIRAGSRAPVVTDSVAPYWADFARLLRIRALLRDRQMREIVHDKRAMSTPVYDSFIRGRERRAIRRPVGDLLSLAHHPISLSKMTGGTA
jgi:thymidylate synthase